VDLLKAIGGWTFDAENVIGLISLNFWFKISVPSSPAITRSKAKNVSPHTFSNLGPLISVPLHCAIRTLEKDENKFEELKEKRMRN
jgi:hypothetical protein